MNTPQKITVGVCSAVVVGLMGMALAPVLAVPTADADTVAATSPKPTVAAPVAVADADEPTDAEVAEMKASYEDEQENGREPDGVLHPGCERVAMIDIYRVGSNPKWDTPEDDGVWQIAMKGKPVDMGAQTYAGGQVVNRDGVPVGYHVKTDDLLRGIADRFCIDAMNLAMLNNLDDQNTIYAGQTLKLQPTGDTIVRDVFIPGENEPRKPATSDVPTNYVVEVGDTAWGISQKFGIPKERVPNRNLRPGEVLDLTVDHSRDWPTS